MRLLFAAALAAMTLSGPAALAGVPQSRLAQSDDWNCNHGDPTAPITIAACYRLRNTSADPGLAPGEVADDTGLVMGAQRVSYAPPWSEERAYMGPRRSCGHRSRAFFFAPTYGGTVLIEGRSVRDWAEGC